MRHNIAPGYVGGEGVGHVHLDGCAEAPLARLKVTVESLQNLWSQSSKTQVGVVVTENADGSIGVSGTSTASDLIYLATSYALRPGGTYVLSTDKPLSSTEDAGGFFVQSTDDDSVNMTIAYANGTAAGEVVFKVPEDSKACLFGVQVREGKTVSGTYRVMLNEGSEAKPWCPSGIGITNKSFIYAMVAGKNLVQFSPELASSTTNGVTFTPLGDGGFRVQGTATAAAYYELDFSSGDNSRVAYAFPFVGKQVTVSKSGGDGLYFSVGVFKNMMAQDWELFVTTKETGSATGTVPEDAVAFRSLLAVESGATVDTVVYPQMELGASATGYEAPFGVWQIPVNRREDLRGIPGVAEDSLELFEGGAIAKTREETDSVVFGGSHGEQLTGQSPTADGHTYFYGVLRKLVLATGLGEVKSFMVDGLRVGDVASGGSSRCCQIRDDLGQFLVYLGPDVADLEAANERLSQNPLTVVYALSMPDEKAVFNGGDGGPFSLEVPRAGSVDVFVYCVNRSSIGNRSGVSLPDIEAVAWTEPGLEFSRAVSAITSVNVR